MAIEDVIRTLNGLKRRHLLRDYAIMGGVAAAAYMEPMFTEDVDIVVLVDSDEEFFRTYRAVGEVADRLEGLHHIIGGTRVQLFPTTTRPLYRDALASARPARVGNLRTIIVTAEHLIVMFLEAFRPKDRVRIQALLEVADQERLDGLLRRFDDERGSLAEKLQTLRGGGV